MAFKVDYLIVHRDDQDVKAVLTAALTDLCDDAPGTELLDQAITIRYIRDIAEKPKHISGASVAFDDEDLPIFSVEDLSNMLHGEFEHVVKLYDSDLLQKNRKLADEIFEIEMKLREAITFIFLHRYGNYFYDLLRDVETKPMTKDTPKEQDMKPHCENQFHYLLFSDYANINSRKNPSNIGDLVRLIGQMASFDDFRARFSIKPISYEKHADFLESLKQRIDPIEKVRNCVAHNRTVSRRNLENYQQAKDELLKSIKEFFVSVSETL